MPIPDLLPLIADYKKRCAIMRIEPPPLEADDEHWAHLCDELVGRHVPIFVEDDGILMVLGVRIYRV